MEFRKSTESDIEEIMSIIRQAQASLRTLGVNQWQNNYPNAGSIRSDIGHGSSYVLLKNEKIAATAAISFDGEKTYDSIYEGQWIMDQAYAVIHRIAVDGKKKGFGIGSDMIKYAERLCLEKGIYSIRVDTHERNLPMRKLLQKNRFQYCGVIYLSDGSERIAFEKTLC
ncbi:GNAT family N-acetyltransferase [Caproiciproducens sp. NJN-50]|uniref:GNAT family N-acetyltransferase n=1 Tax=Caproiciproducens sp. NJN-50 TaxID=2507162 RepID=UPI000FFE0DFE|nr:GNAT family N-acetyltransferase [Caproiciproducens sp. NJN-50]QAT48720.1 GNAT family N-acetyltransferase [Caproiciproducens sp. NJN-50]